MKKTEEIKKPNVIIAFIKLLPMTFTAAPLLFIISILLSTLHGISWGVITLFTQKFFDIATQLVDKKAALSVVILSLIALGSIHLINQILNGVGNFIPQVFAEKASGKLSQKIHMKMSKLSAVSFEDTNTLDDINKAEQGKNYAIWFVLTFLIVFTFYTPILL